MLARHKKKNNQTNSDVKLKFDITQNQSYTGMMSENSSKNKEIQTENKNEMQTKNKDETQTENKDNMQIENKDEKQMEISGADQNFVKHVLCHCQTQFNVKIITFVWSIANFFNLLDSIDTLTSSNIEQQSFKLQMCIDRKKNKLSFSISDKLNAQINIRRYIVSIQGMRPIMLTNWKTFRLGTVLYDMCLETLRLNQTTYVTNNTFVIEFKFEFYDKIFNRISYETITGLRPSLPIFNNSLISDNKSDFLVTLAIDGKLLRIEKSLLCAKSTYFNKMFETLSEEDAKKNIELSDVPYDIFEIIIVFLQTGYFSYTLYKDSNDFINKLYLLLSAADNYDMKELKIQCEKHLIEYTVKANVVLHLHIAIANKAKYLENYAKKLIKLYLNDIIATKDFLNLIENNSKIFVDIMRQELFEEDVSYSTCNNNNDIV
ncbi:uncharacterized protein LOC114254677 [Monomorium pharaonis]|uniref:uncharacterized protein LOC114254677 n=1 Tax=Monomorium pharaonis TaxID=307658 RepID=UPI00102E1288|nr:uncharacterized protein LOC114254677 [Monomorium pharaonis]